MSSNLAHRTASDLASPALFPALRRFVRQTLPRDGLLLVAFSGGPDSTALLFGLTQAAAGGGLHLHAAHLDHGLDADSPRRARAARQLAAAMGIPITVERLRNRRAAGESAEDFARRHRYAFLGRLADRLDASYIATAHHADDQAETVLLRLLFGTGLAGLGAIRPVYGRVVRPLLGSRRAELRQALEGSGLEPVDDPTNTDLKTPRNLVRRRLLPHLEARDPETVDRLCRLADAARRARRKVERRIEPLLDLRQPRGALGHESRGIAVDRRALEDLPEPLLTTALALVHAHAGAPYPASSAARHELVRQLRAGLGVGCDCGDGWRWEGGTEGIRLTRGQSSPGKFAYNLDVPGSVDVTELNLSVRLTRGRVAPWMFGGRVRRAGLAVGELKNHTVVVRNRRPGDRIRPLGHSSRRRLKDLLIDRRVPRWERDRLPLLVIDDEIAWVPGVTIGESFRLDEKSPVWIAEIDDLQAQSVNPPSCRGSAAGR